MKRSVEWILIGAILLTIFLPFGVTASAETPLPAIWDGTVADGFAGGNGTENDPYRIETAAQFAYFRDTVNSGTDFADQHVKLCADLRLNDETFTFDADTGFVKVTDGKYTTYFDTGIRTADTSIEMVSITSLSDEFFGQWRSTASKSPKELNLWSAIGRLQQSNAFNGTFDGGGHTIYGVFLYGKSDEQGLFGRLIQGSVKNLNVDNSVICGIKTVGGIVARAEMNATIENCTFNGIVTGKTQVGGITAISNTTVSSCRKTGVVYGESLVGGIAGRGGAIGCTNIGTVSGYSGVGGIVCLANDMQVESCHNTGMVLGYEYAGGILGDGIAINCLNNAAVYSVHAAGGIVGIGSAEACVNLSKVSGQDQIGGIVGLGFGKNCINEGDISGLTYVGGIAGWQNQDSIISACRNTGSVTAQNYAGGITGATCSTNKMSIIENCYNEGSVSTQKYGGGISGNTQTAILRTCYNIGTVTGLLDTSFYIGALIGEAPSTSLDNNYYLYGCAKDGRGVLHTGIGSANNYVRTDVTGKTTSFAQNALTTEATFSGFDFDGVWAMKDKGAALRMEATTAHTPTMQTDQKYLYRSATCLEAASYYYVCSCGIKQEKTYTYGEKSDKHILPEEKVWQNDAAMHWQICTLCEEICMDARHDYGTGLVTSTKNGKSVVEFACTVCDYKDQSQLVLDDRTESKFEIGLRYVLILLAGITTGALGHYGYATLKNLRKKKGNKDFT